MHNFILAMADLFPWLGIFVMWFLAFFLELSKPIDPDRVLKLQDKYFSKGS